MSIETLITLAVSLAALAVATWSASRTSRASHEQNAIQRRLLDLEAGRDVERRAATRKAVLRAQIGPSGRRDRALSITNQGECTARDVRVFLDKETIARHDLTLHGQNEISVIGPGAVIRYVLTPDHQSGDIVHVRLEWTDDSPDPSSWETQLRIL